MNPARIARALRELADAIEAPPDEVPAKVPPKTKEPYARPAGDVTATDRSRAERALRRRNYQVHRKAP